MACKRLWQTCEELALRIVCTKANDIVIAPPLNVYVCEWIVV